MDRQAQMTESSAKRLAPDSQQQIRLRAAWLYYVEGFTQSEVANRLGVNRIMITRLLSDARSRGEVMISIKSDFAPVINLQRRLEEKFRLSQAIIAPFNDEDGDPTNVIASAAGSYVSKLMTHNLTVGVGWGRTLHTMLPHTEGRALENVRVISMLGGIAQARRFNPAEFAWQFTEMFGAEGFLIPAPAIVDSAQTKHALLEHCGLEQIISMADACDVALFSAGGISAITTSYRVGHISEAERQSLIEAGAVGDVLYHFLDRHGRLVDHPVNQRMISIPIERLSRIDNKVLISGGPEKVDILLATIELVRPSVLVTDELTAASMLDASS